MTTIPPFGAWTSLRTNLRGRQPIKNGQSLSCRASKVEVWCIGAKINREKRVNIASISTSAKDVRPEIPEGHFSMISLIDVKQWLCCVQRSISISKDQTRRWTHEKKPEKKWHCWKTKAKAPGENKAPAAKIDCQTSTFDEPLHLVHRTFDEAQRFWSLKG